MQSDEHRHTDLVWERSNQWEPPPFVVGHRVELVGEKRAETQVEGQLFHGTCADVVSSSTSADAIALRAV
jgi:hypothetical protein